MSGAIKSKKMWWPLQPPGGKSLDIPPIVPGPTEISPGVATAGEVEKEKRKRRRGYGSTIISAQPLGGASLYRKEILGG